MEGKKMMGKANEFIPFKKRGNLWLDVQPLEQYQGGSAPIAPIKYPKEYVEVMSYFRAIYQKQEISERALELTRETIMTSQGQYTAWTYRRKLLHALGKDLGYEIMWLNQIGLLFQKNYQIWHHRRCIFEMWARNVYKSRQEQQEKEKDEGQAAEEDCYEKPMKDYIKELIDNELIFMGDIFEDDAKNYHGWSHLIWLIERYELWTEMRHVEFLEDLLDKDVRNNSVWSFRYFLMERRNLGMFSKATVNMELRYVIEKRLAHDWRNEAAWTYLRGFLANSKQEAENSIQTNAKKCFICEFDWMHKILLEWAQIASYSSFQEMLSSNPIIENKILQETSDGHDALSVVQMQYDGLIANRFLYLTLVDFHIGKEEYDDAVKLLEKLKGFDPIRSKFYEFKQRQLQRKMGN